MPDYPSGSMAEADAKSAKLFGAIAIVAFIVAHVICLIVSDNKFGLVKKTPVLVAINIAAAVWMLVCVYAVLKDALWATEAKWPYIILIALTFASCLMISYCPTC